MLKNLKAEKKLIDAWLLNFLNEEEANFNQQTLITEAFTIIRDFVISGKTVRGGLFLLTTKALDTKTYEKNQKDLLAVAAALELIHSSLLIHDDIIDQDEMRRGQDSVWQKYTKNAIRNNYKNPQNYGQSLAICVGNILNYLADLALARVSNLSQNIQNDLKKTIAQEIIKTNFAEMLDSKITLQNEFPSTNKVLEMYLFKTARYTFSLPLQLAGIINQLPDSQITKLITIGEKLGMIFQIKDDEISLFSTEEESGKSFASDIKESKKTIFYLTLIKNANQKEQEFLAENMGKRDLDQQTIKRIQELFQKYTTSEITKTINQLKKEAQLEIERVDSIETIKLLEKILDFNLNRRS